MTPQQELDRADRAKRILEDDLYKEAFSVVREHLVRKMLATRDEKDRNQYWLQVDLLERLRGTLDYWLQNGKVVIHRMDFERKKREAS